MYLSFVFFGLAGLGTHCAFLLWAYSFFFFLSFGPLTVLGQFVALVGQFSGISILVWPGLWALLAVFALYSACIYLGCFPIFEV